MGKAPAIDIKTGWAIRLGRDFSPGSPRATLVGIYAGSPKVETSPVRVRLWSTRREARCWLKRQRAEGVGWSRDVYWKGAKPVRVGITVEELRNG